MDGSRQRERIVAALKSKDEIEEDYTDEEKKNKYLIPEQKLTHNEGVKFIDRTLQYLQQQGASAADILFLPRLCDKAAQQKNQRVKQKKLPDIFRVSNIV